MSAKRLCDVAECHEPHHARGLCDTHYKQWQRKGTVSAGPIKVVRQYRGARCSVPTCRRRATDRGYCGTHYWRVRAHGDPQAHIPIKMIHRAVR
jgi:hypothetical protein